MPCRSFAPASVVQIVNISPSTIRSLSDDYIALPALSPSRIRIFRSAETVTDPTSDTLKAFHQMLSRHFQEEECEELETFQHELARNLRDPDVRFICVAMRDGKRIVSGAYGSAQDGILAVRFTVTEEPYRGKGISQRASQLLVDAARDFSAARGLELHTIAGECLDRTEAYVNGLCIEPGNPRRRLYLQSADGRSYSELHYEIPPLAWNRDGTPVRDGAVEHLQLAIAGQATEVSPAMLESILRRWWEVWYIRPLADFESPQAWQRHQQHVWDILENRILKPIRLEKGLVPLSKERRRELLTKGYVFS